MKNNKFKKIALFGVGVLSVFGFTAKASAASLEFGTNTVKDNTVTIPINLNIEENDSIEKINLSCTTSIESVTCELDKSNETDLIYTGGFINNKATETFPVGKTNIYNLVLSNESSEAASDVFVTIKDSTSSVSDLKNNVGISLKAKKMKSTDAKLKSVVISSGAIYPSFDPEVTSYTVFDIKDSVASVKITPTCNDGVCTFSITGGAGVNGKNVSLKDGSNEVKLTVTAEDQATEKVYTFNIIRGESSFGSTLLASLETGEYTLSPAFQSDVLEYTMIVPNKVTTLTQILKCSAADETNGAKCEISGYDNIKEGENTVTIKVTGQTGDTKTYTIKVNRLSGEGIVVKTLVDKNVTFVNATGETQTLTLDEFKKLYEEEATKITSGVYKFDEQGNLIVEEEKKEETKTGDNKEKKGIDKKIIIIILLIVIGIAIIVVAGVLIFKKRPESIEEPMLAKKDDDSAKEIEEETNEVEEESEEETTEEIKEDNNRELDKTYEIDEALSDLMSTKQYNFDDEE